MGCSKKRHESEASARAGSDASAQLQRRVGYTENLDAVKELARNEPRLVASVVKEWVSGDE